MIRATHCIASPKGRAASAAAAHRPPASNLLQLTYKEGPLSGQAIIRGAYVNTASKDVGIDPDFQKVGAEGFADGLAGPHPHTVLLPSSWWQPF
jgi:hypothetical protein